jgi:hypothetical protein
LFERVKWFSDLTCDFWAENAKNKLRVRAKAIKSVASPSGYAPAFGRAVGPSARLFYGTRERVPFRCAAWQFASHPSQKREGWGTRSVWLVVATEGDEMELIGLLEAFEAGCMVVRAVYIPPFAKARRMGHPIGVAG